MVKLEPGETLWFSFIVYKNRAQRNAVNKKVMQEMKRHKMPKVMPFDRKRMAHSGFKTIVQGWASVAGRNCSPTLGTCESA